jgi:hypothetical protein
MFVRNPTKAMTKLLKYIQGKHQEWPFIKNTFSKGLPTHAWFLQWSCLSGHHLKWALKMEAGSVAHGNLSRYQKTLRIPARQVRVLASKVVKFEILEQTFVSDLVVPLAPVDN